MDLPDTSVLTETQQIARMLKSLTIGELRAIEGYAMEIRYKLQEAERLKLMEAV